MHGQLLITKQDLHAYLVQSKQDLRTELAKTIGLEIAKNLQPVHVRVDRCEKDVLDLKKAI